MTKAEQRPPATSPEWFEKAFEEPEVYWVSFSRGLTASYVGKWIVLYTSRADAESRGQERARESGCVWVCVETTTLRRQLEYCVAKYRLGVRIMARDENGWFVLREIPV